MKARIILAGIATSSLLFLGGIWAFAQPKGDTTSVKGEVVDLWCYLEGGDHGADHKQCAITCAKAGNPIGLLTDKGDLYVLMGIKDHDPAKDALIDKMAANVTVDGTLVKKGGVQVIYVTSIKQRKPQIIRSQKAHLDEADSITLFDDFRYEGK